MWVSVVCTVVGGTGGGDGRSFGGVATFVVVAGGLGVSLVVSVIWAGELVLVGVSSNGRPSRGLFHERAWLTSCEFVEDGIHAH